MMRIAICLTFAAALAGQPILSPADTLAELGRSLGACFQAPPGTTGDQITVRLSLTRDGQVRGSPRITFSRLVGSAESQRAFVTAALSSLARCTPVRVTPALGAAMAGRPIAIRFLGGTTPQAI